jgi:ABC-2 type transport system permease protein
MVGKHTQKYSSYIRLLLVIGIIILVNVLSDVWFFRIDLTKEKRFTLSKASTSLAAKLDDVLYVKVYLEGDFPAGFKRLRNATRELLDEYRIASGNKIEYEFIDPFEGKDKKQISEIIEQLGANGLFPTNVQVKQDDELSQKIVIPGAIFYYKGKEYPLNLLKGQFGKGGEETINESIELLEYQVSNVLRKCTVQKKKKIAFLVGNGELKSIQVADFGRELSEFYELARLDIHKNPPQKFNEFDGLVIAKPDSVFSEYDKFKIDQYIMHGGKVIWMLDMLFADMDSARNAAGEFMAYNYDLNLDDIPFRYGVRVNPVLVQDLQCNRIPIMSGYTGGQQQTKLLPWLYYPILGSTADHPIVKNLDYVWAQFCNTIDTLPTKNIRKTVLLHTSDYTRVVGAPARVNINMTRLQPNPMGFPQRRLPVAVLLEGDFTSVFKDRVRSVTDSSFAQLHFAPSVSNNKMIVIADGDIARNQVSKSGDIYPLGFDKFTNQNFGNKNFMVNCVDYLCDDSGLIEVRMKEIKLRLLDRQRMKDEKLQWQLVNMVLPVVLIVLFGINNARLRKRKFTR